MKQYLDIVRNVLDNGVPKHPTRDGIEISQDTVGTFAEIFRHDMSQGFPLLTTKKMPIRTIAVELEGFIKGITSKKWYQDRGCKIWNEWANPLAVQAKREDNQQRWTNTDDGSLFFCEVQYLDCKGLTEKDYINELQAEQDDLGPIYGYQWRSFNKAYDEADDGCATRYDQFKYVCDTLKSNPYDRRMVVSAWNPIQYTRMALPPCHFAWNVVVYGNKLNLIWHQRSVDLALGASFNIASYAMLLLLLANHSGLEPGELVGTFNDCHIYKNQEEMLVEQLKRTPRELPHIDIKCKDIFDWTHEDIIIDGYNPCPKIKIPVTVN